MLPHLAEINSGSRTEVGDRLFFFGASVRRFPTKRPRLLGRKADTENPLSFPGASADPLGVELTLALQELRAVAAVSAHLEMATRGVHYNSRPGKEGRYDSKTGKNEYYEMRISITESYQI